MRIVTLAPMGTSRIRSHLPAAALLAVYLAMAISAASQKSMTADELYHTTAGVTFWKFNEYRFGVVNGILQARLEALPLVLGGYRIPSRDLPAWHRTDILGFGLPFFFNMGNDGDAMLLRARTMSVLLTAVLGWVIYAWSSRLFTRAGGLISLTLFVFCPLMLSHGAMATSDAAAALFMLASIGSLWAAMRRLTLGSLLAACASVSLLFVSKHTSLLLIPLAGVMGAWVLAMRQPMRIVLPGLDRTLQSRFSRVAWLAALAVAAGISVWCTIWAFYGFKFSMLGAIGELRGDSYPGDIPADLRGGGMMLAMDAMRRFHFLPEAYLLDVAKAFFWAVNRLSYLRGQFNMIGWWWYFPYAMLIKTPLSILAIWAAAAGLLVRNILRQGWASSTAWAPLLILIVGYLLIGTTSTVNTGVRHVMPVYAALYVLSGATAWLLQRRTGAIVLGGLLLWTAIDSLLIHPDYLAYFNPIAGGPANGHRHLLDSNLDWGQDLKPLKKWLAAHRDGQDVYLSYFGNIPIDLYGIEARAIGCFPPQAGEIGDPDFAPGQSLKPGLYCISANQLLNLYRAWERDIGPWTSALESEYQAAQPYLLQLRQAESSPRQYQAAAARFKPRDYARLIQLRFLRLLALLRQRMPEARAGYSIFIYRVTQDELDRALTGPPPELLPAPRLRG